MKGAKTSKNKDSKKFKNALNPNPKESPKRAATKEDRKDFSQSSSKAIDNDKKLDISPMSSDDERSSNKNVVKALGFFPMNTLTKSNKGAPKSEIKSQRQAQPGGQLSARSPDKGSDKVKKSLFKSHNDKKIRPSNSIGVINREPEGPHDYKKGDLMNIQDGQHESPWNVTQEWQNEKDIGNYSRHSKRNNRNAKVASRDGSRKSKRHKKLINSIQSKQTKLRSKSRQGNRRVIHNPKNAVVFNEFQVESQLDNQISMRGQALQFAKASRYNSTDPIIAQTSKENSRILNNESGRMKIGSADGEGDNEIDIDESKLNDAISDSYSLCDRSCSFSVEGESFMKEDGERREDDFIEIVDQDSFEKLEAYRDRCPFLGLRKWILKIKLIITKAAHAIISHQFFEGISLTVIIANSIVLAFEDPQNPDANKAGPLAVLDTVFLILYTVEMCLKILGLGFVLNKGSYLRDNWNILDFVIVVSAYVELLMSSGANLSVLRSFRVLRPLRTISGIKGLRIIVSALMKSVALLVDTVIILIFFFIIFAVAGLQLWSGVLKKRCVNEYTGVVHEDDDL